MAKILVPKQEMIDILDSGEGVAGEGVVIDEQIGNSRWAIQHRLIFQKDGKLYSANYQVGSTEQQDESPWEYQTEVECTEVEPYEKTVTAYRPVA